MYTASTSYALASRVPSGTKPSATIARSMCFIATLLYGIKCLGDIESRTNILQVKEPYPSMHREEHLRYTQKQAELRVFVSCDGYSYQNPMPGTPAVLKHKSLSLIMYARLGRTYLMQQGKSKSSWLGNFFPFVHLKAWTSDSFVPPSLLTAFKILGYVTVVVTNTLLDFGSMYLHKAIIK